MKSNFLLKTLIRCFGETKTIKMLNSMQKRKVNKKASRYKESLAAHMLPFTKQ